LPKVKLNRPTSLLIIVTVVLLIGGVLAYLSISPPDSPTARILGRADPGRTIIVHGEHYPAQQQVKITTDTLLGNTTSGNASINTNASGIFYRQHQSKPTDNVMMQWQKQVSSDGIFDVPILIDPSWQPGSEHKFYIYTQDGQLTTTLPFTIPRTFNAAPSNPSGCDTASGVVNVGTQTENAKQPVSKSITLCTNNAGAAQTGVASDQKWLRAGRQPTSSPSQFNINANTSGLSPGVHAGNLTFDNGSGAVPVKVVVVVLKHQPSPQSKVDCVSATPQALSFTASSGQQAPLSQNIMLNNCGSSATWTGFTSTNTGDKWLNIGQTGGTLVQGNLQYLSVTISSLRLLPGTYTGSVHLAIGSSSMIVPVTLTILAPNAPVACLDTSTHDLFFTASAGQSDPVAQQFSLINCGAGGHWSGSSSTNDSDSWLHFSPGSNDIGQGNAQTVTVSVAGAPLDPSRHTGKLTFRLGNSMVQINVTFNIKDSCVFVASSPLSFKSIEGTDETFTQSITIRNLNCQTVGTWYATTDTGNTANSDWLTITTKPQGELPPGGSQDITVRISNKNLSHGIYTGSVVFAMGNRITTVPVTFVVTLQQAAINCLSVNTHALHFTAMKGQGNPTPQTLTLGNCGAAGSWTATSSDPWLNLSSTSGTWQNRKDTQDIQVTPGISGLDVGKTYTSVITFKQGTSIQTITVTVAIQQGTFACIHPDTTSLSLTAKVHQGLITLSNCADEGSWSIPSTTPASWLQISSSKGHLRTAASTTLSFTESTLPTKQGTYSVMVPVTLVTSSGKTDRAEVIVTLTIGTPTGGNCTVQPTSLSFSAKSSIDVPATQSVTFTHCGDNDGWQAGSYKVNGGTLYTTPSNGVLDGNGSVTLQVALSSSALMTNGSDSLHFSTGRGLVVDVPVSWKVTPPAHATCIQAVPASLPPIIATEQQRTSVAAMTVSFINCGAEPGSITVGSSSNWLSVNGLNAIDGSRAYLPGAGPDVSIFINDGAMGQASYEGTIHASIATTHATGSTQVSVVMAVQQQAPPPVVPPPDSTASPVPGESPTTTSTSETTSPTAVTSPTITDSPTVTETPTVTVSSTVTVGPTDTPTSTETPTANPTVSPTVTSGPVTPTPTSIPITPTPTSVPVTPTPTSVPVTPTPTSIPVTPTPTSVPVTPTPTSIPITPTPVPTPVPTQPPQGTPQASRRFFSSA
jgi:hypothetical protein